tara:strand:- start:6664 stop:7692 length:1029 start_codon:yes stop_codon:yes gene_type:complete
MLTKESQSLIDSFLSKTDIQSFLKDPSLKLFYHSLSKNHYEISKVIITHGTKLFPQSDFLANSLSKKIKQRQNVLTMKWTTFSKYNIHCILNIYLKENEKFPDTALLMKAISFITSFSNKERKFNIHLCLLPDKKLLRKNQKKITKLNINSGSNLFSDTESEICVFRKEEAIKVLFHEIIHGLRFSNLGSDELITQKLCQKYNLQSKDILIDESYTEIWAKIFNCYFVSSLTNSDKKFQHFCTMLSLEKEFSLYQANKIKQFVKKSKDKNLDKDTNVSAYFLVVGEIFSHFNDFLKLFPHPYQNKKKCLNFIYHLNTVKKRKISMNDKFYNSMRMTIIELKL